MKLTYQTGIAALIHLAVISLFNLANGMQSGVAQCTNNGTDCLGNVILSILYFMLLTVWFASLWVLASAAQVKRSRKLAILLIGAEFMVFAVSIFNAQHHNNLLGLVTSIVDATFAVWVGFLALRIVTSNGVRVTGSARTRRRRLSD